MIKSILVPMGTSKYSEYALKTAVQLANLFKAELRLLYVEDTARMKSILLAYKSVGGVSLDLPALDQEMEQLKTIKQDIEKEKAEVRRMYDEAKGRVEGGHSLVFREGDVAEEILREARKADLAVMGKSLRSTAADCMELQAAILRVVHRSNKPVLATCEDVLLDGKILVAYDGSRAANNALSVLADFLPFLSAQVSVLTVGKGEEEAAAILDEAGQYLAPYRATVEKIRKAGNAAERIVETAKEKGATLIVMGGYGDNKLKELMLGSTAEKVLKTADIPVLVSSI